MQPTQRHQAGHLQTPSYLALLQLGFTEPFQSPGALVVSCTTVSPLPVRIPKDSPSAVYSLLHFPEVAPAGISPVAYPVESGLSSSNLEGCQRPLGSLSDIVSRLAPIAHYDRRIGCRVTSIVTRYREFESNVRKRQCLSCHVLVRWCCRSA